ncbi:l-lactate dehydrogenase-like protein [Aaosphaeria arxii CBS 175.79]|uniref:L-lactate dehydrogenase n=1 Tax=Aaosphaeria arxii CBS 175.79 TaxID=1450172 RepID=A0A6A5XT27_9PLEO|nr:l-lactate dehydrogenase-like protein [Aaosphaeria arxii CBS 175.79]KAF2015840.1 l-lactate dehydrogenase-like protein [Aaosphaeria arxii CBS 175.79]
MDPNSKTIPSSAAPPEKNRGEVMAEHRLKTSVAIIGCGDVGSTLAYTLVLQPICSEVILVDPKEDLLQAQVRDLGDATYRGQTGARVRAGTHKDAGQADIVVITAGAKQKIGESRLSLLSRNLHILSSIFQAMSPINPNTILLLVANPVDILTYFARKLSGLPESQVLGTGTTLDSARLRGILAQKADVAPNSIDAYVLGEHGDSQFIAWSSCTIGTSPLRLALPQVSDPAFKKDIADHTRGAAAAIIAAKGCTAYGIGMVAASICKYILFDSRTVRPLSFYQPELGCCLSMPAVIGRKGIIKKMPIELDESEQKNLEECAGNLRAVIDGAEKEMMADEQLRKALEADKGS